MSKSASKLQEKVMAIKFRGKEVFKPLNTGIIDERVKCVREFVANIFFYTKNGTTIMIDAGYNYERLREKMEWLGLKPEDIKHILLTHQDTDHLGRWSGTAMDCSPMRRFISVRSKTAISQVRCGAKSMVVGTSCLLCRSTTKRFC